MRAPRRCQKCRNLVPCPVHPRGWASNKTTVPVNWDSLRNAVAVRDGRRCQMCGSTERLEVDHIIERADGGCADCLSNLRFLCHDHHLAKTYEARNLRRQGRGRR